MFRLILWIDCDIFKLSLDNTSFELNYNSVKINLGTVAIHSLNSLPIEQL